MAAYGYKAITKAGKEVKGSLEADNKDLAMAELRRQELTVIDLGEQSFLTKDIDIQIGGWPKARDLSVMCRQFVSMTKAGVSILESLKMLCEQTENKRLQDALKYDNVYLNDDSATPYVASDFLTDCKGNAAKAATFGAVLKEIQYENFLAKKNNSNAAQMDEKISKASITRYILNWYMHRVTVKSSIRVLDLEPCCDFNKTLESELQTAVVNMMGMTGIYDASAINLKQMSSAEFIGKVEDLNEKYDMIYLGARVSKMNTENGVTVYNDPQMKGLIYSHVGDYYDYATETDTKDVTQARETYNARHRLQDSSLDHNKTNDDDSTNKSADVYRGPGNDMNSTRYEEFCQFIEAGYPVVIADTFIKVDNNNIPVASTATLDKNSYFYKLVDFALQKDANGQYLYWQKNIFTESQLTDNTADTKLGTTLSARRSVFCNYLNLSKLSVNWVTTYGAAYPQELKYNSNQNGASNGGSLEKIDGKYQLQYIFNLQNDAAISQTGTTYDCKLFVDKNADGRFSGSDYVEGKPYTSSEEVSGLLGKSRITIILFVMKIPVITVIIRQQLQYTDCLFTILLRHRCIA